MSRSRVDVWSTGLEPNAVHVHEAGLLVDECALERFAKILDPHELERASRFATPALRRKYIASHGTLRVLLGRYLGLGPENVRFVCGEHGKPALDPAHASDVRFNLSHSGEKCLVAVTDGREVGVDVELIRALAGWQDIAERFFSEREVARLARLPAMLAQSAFFATWSRKEAYIKAVGLGLAFDLKSFEVEVDPRVDARLIWSRDVTFGPELCHMHSIDVGESYAGAVAVAGRSTNLVLSTGDVFLSAD